MSIPLFLGTNVVFYFPFPPWITVFLRLPTMVQFFHLYHVDLQNGLSSRFRPFFAGSTPFPSHKWFLCAVFFRLLPLFDGVETVRPFGSSLYRPRPVPSTPCIAGPCPRRKRQ